MRWRNCSPASNRSAPSASWAGTPCNVEPTTTSEPPGWRRLTTEDFTVMTGGGPGAVEGGQHGSPPGRPIRGADLHPISRLAERPVTPRTRRTGWPPPWRCVRRPTRRDALSACRRFYGHEPSNVFATAIAKYFSNALRGDILLQHCRGGIICRGLPAPSRRSSRRRRQTTPPTPPRGRPDGLRRREALDEKLPVWQLVQALGKDRTMGERLLLVDDVDDAADYLIGRSEALDA